MNIQIFGTRKSFDTKKAQRYFKERRIKFQFVDLREKGLSKGELQSVANAVGDLDRLLDPKAKDEDTLALIRHLVPAQRFEKLLENQQVLAEPIVRNGRRPPSATSPTSGRAGSNGTSTGQPWAQDNGTGTGQPRQRARGSATRPAARHRRTYPAPRLDELDRPALSVHAGHAGEALHVVPPARGEKAPSHDHGVLALLGERIDGGGVLVAVEVDGPGLLGKDHRHVRTQR